MTEVAVAQNASTAVDVPNPKNVVAYSSVTGNDKNTKVMVYNAVTNAESLGDKLGEVINVAHVVIAPVALESEQTGDTEIQPRVTLIDVDGKGYYATSGGIFEGINQLISIFGQPEGNDDWPLEMYAEEIKTAKGRRLFQLRLVTGK